MAYILNNQNIASWRPVNNNRPLYEKVLSIFPAAERFSAIDLGSGAGEFSQIIKPLVKKLTCVDFSAKYVNQLKKVGLRAIKADLNQPLPFRSGYFDLAISLEVIEHLAKAEDFLLEAYRILKPDGILIISTPNIAWWGYRLFSLLGNPPKKEGYHLRFFTDHTLRYYLNQAGFQVIKSANFTTVPLLNKLLIYFKIHPIYPIINFMPNLLAQDLVFLCRKQ